MTHVIDHVDPVVAFISAMERLTEACEHLTDREALLDNDARFSRLATAESFTAPTTVEGVWRKIEWHFPGESPRGSDVFTLHWRPDYSRATQRRINRFWRELRAVSANAKAGALSRKDARKISAAGLEEDGIIEPHSAGVAQAIAEGVRLIVDLQEARAE